MKLSITNKNNYLVVSLEKALTDTEFIELKSKVLQRTITESIRGVVIDLHALDVIDSFATRTLHSLALSAAEKKVLVILTGIKPVVAEIMERQGLNFPDKLVNKGTDVSEGLTQLKEHHHNYY